MPRRTYTTDELISKFVQQRADGCWVWKGRRKLTYSKKEWFAHRLLYTLLIGDIPEGKILLHDCAFRGCVNPSHRYLGSREDAPRVREKLGRTAVGGRGRGKLTTDQVLAIRAAHPASTIQTLAIKYGVDPHTIRNIVYRATWRHLPE